MSEAARYPIGHEPAPVLSAPPAGTVPSKPVFPTEQENNRSRLVEAKMQELAAQHGLDLLHPENWRERDLLLRDRIFGEAQAAIPGAKATQITGPKEYQFDGNPADAIEEARQVHADALAARDTAAEVLERAANRMVNAEQELEAYSDLDDRVEGWTVSRLKANKPPDLSHELRTAQENRSKARDRFDTSKTACARLTRELADAEVAVTSADRILRAAATAAVHQSAEQMAADLEILDAQAHELREALLSLASAWLPGLHGPLPLPSSIVAAINKPAPVAEPRQEWIDRFRLAHAEVISGGGIIYEDADDAA